MSGLDSTVAYQPLDEQPLSPAATERLSGLLASLDRLDVILGLPEVPTMLAEGLPFAHYRLRSRLGAGRFGIVLLADDPALGRQIVLKVPQPAVLADPQLRERFAREARASARLEHPGIVSVFEAGEVDGLPFLAAALVRGPTLRQWRIKHPSPVSANSAARLVCSVAWAVQHAHERGVLHCDLAPSNVLLQRLDNVDADSEELADFAPLVADFGLARLMDEDPALTQTFQVAGTLMYMSPEQARGDRRNLTSQTDVYALGVVLYDLLIGTPPFVGTATTSVVAQLQTEPPQSPRQRLPSVPRDLDAICLKCLEKAPTDRYVSALALAEDLQRFLNRLPVVARPVPPLVRVARWISRNSLIASVLFVTVVAAAIAIGVAADRWFKENQSRADLAISNSEKSTESARAEAAEARLQTSDFYLTLEQVRQRRLARAAGWAAENRADLMRICARGNLDDSVAVRTEAAAVAGAIDLGAPRAVAVGFHGYNIAFDPSGQTLAIGGFIPDELRMVTVRLLTLATDTDARRLHFTADRSWEARAGSRRDGCWSVAFSPDGNYLAVGTRAGHLVIWNLSGSKSDPIARWRHSPPTEGGPQTARHERITRLAFDDRGRLWSGDDTTVAAWEPARDWAEAERQSGELGRTTAGRHLLITKGVMAAAHPTGLFHIRRLADQELVICWPDASPIGRLALPDDDRADDSIITDFVVNPGGTTVVATAEHAGHLKLWDLAGGRLAASRIMSPGSLRVAIHPDGHSLAVVESDRVQVFNFSHPTTADLVGIQPCPIDDVDLTPDGRCLATMATIPNRPGIFDLHIHDLSVSPFGQITFHKQLPSPVGNSRKRLAISSDGLEIVTHQHDSYVRLHPPDPTPKMLNGPLATRDIRFSRSGSLWAVGADSVFAWRDGNNNPFRSSSNVGSLTVGNDGALVGQTDGTLARFSAAGELLRVDRIANTAITGLAQDGERCIAGTATGEVLILNGQRVVQTIPHAHADAVWAIAIGPDGWFATGSGDRLVRIWDADGREVFSLPQTRPVRRLFWIDKGRTLAILAEGERAVRRWHIAELLTEFRKIGIDSGLPDIP